MSHSQQKREELLNALFDITLEELIRRIQSGEAKPADLAVARAILKDNNIECLPDSPGNKLGDLAALMPFKPGEDNALNA